MPSLNRREALAMLGAASAACVPAWGQSPDLAGLTLKKASDMLRRKAVSPVELTEACLRRIEKYNPAINAFITVTRDSAMATAREMEAEAHRGKWRGPLHGIPIAIKDNIDTAGVRTTGASELFKDRVPNEDAEVIRKLKLAGAIFLGKLNMHEFAYGPSSAVTYYAQCIILGRSIESPGDRPEVPPLQLPRISVLGRSVRTPEDRSGSRVRTAEQLG